MTQSPSLPELPKDERLSYGHTTPTLVSYGLACYEAGSAAAAQAVPEGLSLAQEPKYTVSGSAIVNRASGEAIPADEPVFIFRARDKLAVSVLDFYSSKTRDPQHYAAVRKRMKQFRQFASRHPKRMKSPDTAPTQGVEGAGQVEAACSLPDRDRKLSNRAQGVYRKFDVRRTDGSDQPGCKHEGCEYFVIDVTHDQHAKAALTAYADACDSTHSILAADMRDRYYLAAAPASPQAPAPQAVVAEASERIALLETALSEVLEFQSAREGPHIFDWRRWRRIRDNTPPFQRAALAQHQPQQGEQHE